MKIQSDFSITVLRKRLLSVLLAITFLFCFLIGRFFYLQVVCSEKLYYLALDQWTREIPLIARRGNITDRNGVVLAGSSLSYSVFARPRAVVDIESTAETLSSLFSIDGEALENKLKQGKSSEITVVKKTGKENVEKLSAYDLSGVYYAEDNTRVYPYGDLLSRVIGFTSSDNTGTTGIEKYYDDLLSGKNGEILFDTDLVGVEIEEGSVKYLSAESGYHVALTVDLEIQLVAEQVMKKAYAEHNPRSAACLVLDPQSFEVLALAEAPSFDLNDPPRDQISLLNSLSRNSLFCDVYEPGSTFKVVTAASDIEEWLKGNPKALSTSHVFSSAVTRSVDGTTIKCWSTHANGKHANQTIAEALNNSCNPCFVDMALALGKDTFYEYLKAFHFGSVTGIDFSGEAHGLLMPCSAVRDCDLARIGFGQTIAVTGLQLACAVASAVNGGYYYTPRLLSSVTDEYGNLVKKGKSVLLNRTISEKASSLLSSMLEGVVRDGSGKKAYIEGYRIGGKTGTAQKYENGRIAAGKYVSSFVGFFPSDDPQYLCLIVVDEPQGTYYGSAVAAPLAKEVFQGIIDAKNIKSFV